MVNVTTVRPGRGREVRMIGAIAAAVTGAALGCSSAPTPRANLASSVAVEKAQIVPYDAAPGWKAQAVSLILRNNGTQPIGEIWGNIHVYDDKGHEIQSDQSGGRELLWMHYDNSAPQDPSLAQPLLMPHQTGSIPKARIILDPITKGAFAKSVKVEVTNAFETPYLPNGADDPQLEADHLTPASPASASRG